MTVWAPVMFLGEFDMLYCRLEAMQDYDVHHVIVESPVTHRGIPKPLHFTENAAVFASWADRITCVTVDLPQPSPWAREHAQRNAAWPAIASQARNEDVVLIGDLDEIPSPALLEWAGPDVAAVRMRTCLFAADWEVPQAHVPPQCVIAEAGWLRRQAAAGRFLAEVRDARDSWPVFEGGGTHLSWIGGPERQREKLETATCHTELLGTFEGDLIARGERWRTSQDGGGLPVVPVEVDESWPAYVHERRCPAEWFRPRESEVRCVS